jgi:hypothetical protein
MNDRDIQQLIRMAGEIERLEGGLLEEGPVFRINRAPSDPWKLVRVSSLSGIAAAVLLAGVVAMKMTATPPPSAPQPLAVIPAKPSETTTVQPVAASDANGCVVLTMFKDGDNCNCVQMQTKELAGRLEELPRAELIRMALQSPCTTQAQKVVVLAVSGRKDALPKTREDAEALAARMSESGHADLTSHAYASMPSLGSDATVITETVAWKRPAMPIDSAEIQKILRQ